MYNAHKLKVEGHEQCLSLSSEGMDWKYATCAVCMEPPHNAILLLCSSHDKGCRPYMCDTSCYHSNCLDLFKKAGKKSMSTNDLALRCLCSNDQKSSESLEPSCPQCPLCRGQVKGWTVVEPARKFLNSKKRSCMEMDCSFRGTYRELQKHLKKDHPLARPQEVDPQLEKQWKELVLERERQDVLSFIRSSMPNSVILGDYVLERDGDDDVMYDNRSTAYGRFNGFYFLRNASNTPRAHLQRRRHRRRTQARWFLCPRPFSFARFGWNLMYN
ncbi:hypothetical protein HPP92_018621 [Vanilla planifolia]|uniref:Uncharacterized protein n=1 Tax=Vanilla planifolia TaxID=51239 RepID=A0A835QIG2_VANPL|nr:hypothetical protein HPP92_018621 [Vanilla planifolia]